MPEHDLLKEAADLLLERKPDESYIAEWTELLQEQKVPGIKTTMESLVVFRLGQECFGMPTVIFQEIAERRSIHKIPHRKNPNLMGLTNFRGQLRVCINMHHFLEIDTRPQHETEGKSSAVVYERMLAIQLEEDFWIFPVDEVLGIFRFDLNQLENVPVTVSKSSVNYMKGVLLRKNLHIAVLDQELIHYSLKRSLNG